MLPQLAGQLLFFLTTISLLPSTASASTSNWLFPAYVPNAPLVTFDSQDTIDASWTSEFVAPVLTMFCETSNSGDFSVNFQSPAPVLPNGSYAVPLDTVQDPNTGCHLNLEETNGPLTSAANGSNSGNFFVNVQSDRSATTWSAPIAAATTSSSSSSSSSSSTSTSTSIPTTTSSSLSSLSPGTPSAAAATATSKSVSPQTNTGLSSGAKAGIGVGVALGVLALISAGLLLWMRSPRKQRQSPPPEPQKQEYGGTYASEVDGGHTLLEMDGRNPQEEKDGFPIARRQTAGELEADPVR